MMCTLEATASSFWWIVIIFALHFLSHFCSLNKCCKYSFVCMCFTKRHVRSQPPRGIHSRIFVFTFFLPLSTSRGGLSSRRLSHQYHLVTTILAPDFTHRMFDSNLFCLVGPMRFASLWSQMRQGDMIKSRKPTGGGSPLMILNAEANNEEHQKILKITPWQFY